MDNKKITYILITILVLIFLALPFLKKKNKIIISSLSNKVALINITGEIIEPTETLRLLNIYNDMDNVKAIVLRINSPGGGVSSSQEIYEQIKKIRENGKRVVVSMGDVAASGAYYIASAADKIYANSGTITGSIGVIINYMNAKKLLDKIGVEFVTVKSGQYKDTGTFARESTEKEKELLNKLIKDVLNQVVDDVIETRYEKIALAAGIKIKDEKEKKKKVKEYVLTNIADGRIFTGKEAKSLGLVDEIGNIDDAIEGAAKMIGLKGRPMVISERKRTGFFSWLDSKFSNFKINEKEGFIIKFLLK